MPIDKELIYKKDVVDLRHFGTQILEYLKRAS